MANVMDLLISNYSETLESLKDPQVDKWLLMHSAGPMLSIVGIYLLLILKIGPQMMESRPAFQINNAIIAYNGFQILLSLWIALLSVKTDFLSYVFTEPCTSKLIGNKDHQFRIAITIWWYFISKVIDLLDTVRQVFFVMRKKGNQITYLHVHHHASMVVATWAYLKYLPAEQGLVLIFLNCCVHVIMYSYYLIAALGPQYKKYLWWKEYMTSIQIMQFGLMLIYLVSTLIIDCPLPMALSWAFTLNTTSFLYMFVNFYRKSYTGTRTTKKKT